MGTFLICGLIFLGCAVVFVRLFADLGEAFNSRLLGRTIESYNTVPMVAYVRGISQVKPGISDPFASAQKHLDQWLVYAGRPYGDLSGRSFLDAVIFISAAVGTLPAICIGIVEVLGGTADIILIASRCIMTFVVVVCLVIALFVLELLSRASRIAEAIGLDFPFFLDLALLVVQSGGTPQQAIKSYVENNSDNPLSQELRVTLQDAQVRSLDTALLDMSYRVKPASVQMILRNLAQSERSTGRVADFYAEQALELRTIRHDLAERAAERVRVNMTFPTILMTIAIAIALLAGTIIQLHGII